MQYLQPGTTLQGGKYRIERVLGQGGFGITYLAVQIDLNRPVAIKELFLGGKGQAINDRRGNMVVVTNNANQQSFDQQKEKFKKEASRLAQLNHPNLVKVNERFEENGTAYFVMDYIEGESLRTIMNREGKLPEKVVLEYLKQIVSALEVAHSQNIWHLDIKPENIMIDKYGHVYLIDFGASKHIEQNGTLTTSLALAYTPGYCPPELADLTYDSQDSIVQALKDIGPWTDIYALGATLYNLLTENIPPSSRRLYKDGKNAFSFPENVSSSTKDLIAWMMKPDFEDRPKSVKQISYNVNRDVRGEETVVEYGTPKAPAATPANNKPRIEAKTAKSSKGVWKYFVVGGIALLLVLTNIPSGIMPSSCSAISTEIESSDPVQQNKIGNMYATGKGREKNMRKAAYYYRLAAEQGNKYAQHNLGFCYWDGTGVERDRDEAVKWLRRAADQGYKPSIKFLKNNGLD